jgi:hypothetical protein
MRKGLGRDWDDERGVLLIAADQLVKPPRPLQLNNYIWAHYWPCTVSVTSNVCDGHSWRSGPNALYMLSMSNLKLRNLKCSWIWNFLSADMLKKFCTLEHFRFQISNGQPHKGYRNIPKYKKKKSEIRTLLVPSISEKGYSTCICHQPGTLGLGCFLRSFVPSAKCCPRIGGTDVILTLKEPFSVKETKI